MINRRAFLFAAAGFLAAPGRAAGTDALKMRTLYNKDLSFSDLALAQQGKPITVAGYMAPPLKAETNFFVLTSRPLAVCPFCESEADWPDDILAVYGEDVISVVPFNYPIVVTGILELGTRTDENLGFVSRVRLVDARFEKLR